MKTISIKNKIIGRSNPPYIIAEMACAHDGDYNKALKLIDAAASAGADAVQLQFFVATETVTPLHPVFELLQKIEFSHQQWTDLFNYARSKNIHVFVCTYDLPSVHLAIQLKADGIKLNSADLSNPEVVKAVAASKIPFTLGTGASTIDEIASGLRLAKENGATDIILMHGVQNFPTQTPDLNISRVKLLQQIFDMPVGYHDHTEGDDPFSKIVDLIAVGMGAHVIEKHITLNRAEKGIDYQAALEPNEFTEFVKLIQRAWVALGSMEIKAFTESDLKYRKFQKKSIVALQNIKAGEIITREKIGFIRNEEPGLPPSQADQIIGKKAEVNLNQYQNILTKHIEN